MFQNVRTKLSALVALMVTAMVAAPAAFAQTAPAAFDDTEILSTIAAYSAIAVGLAAAIIAALWVMRVLGLLKPKH